MCRVFRGSDNWSKLRSCQARATNKGPVNIGEAQNVGGIFRLHGATIK